MLYSKSLEITTDDFNLIIRDSIPRFLRDEGALEVRHTEEAETAGIFGRAIYGSLRAAKGEMFLLLGGIGSGKTTFIKRYQRHVGQELLSKNVWFHIDFLSPPNDPTKLEEFVWTEVLTQLRERYSEFRLERRRIIKRIFSAEIAALSETALRDVAHDPGALDSAISGYLEKWQQALPRYVPGLLRECSASRKLGIVLFVDNVDQLSPAYQSQIFLVAQRVTAVVGCLTIVALREESYYAASVQRTFTAYTTHKFHIASPRFRFLIGKRIQYALQLLEKRSGDLPIVLGSSLQIDTRALADFLYIVQYSIFAINKNISRFIEAICFGDMRSALQMFATFLTSGVTDVDKMLWIYRRDGAYFVAYHEFLKSIMLGARRYYKESESPIMNLFDCGAERNSSHFTALRILSLLWTRRGEYSPEGLGYVELARVVIMFEDVFDNREDLVRTLNRLVVRHLVETNTRSTESIQGATHIRATSAGWYYRRHLARSFPYLDLVLQDTPVDSEGVERELRDAMSRVDNLSDSDEDKLERMQVRFRRVELFLEYLAAEERREREAFRLVARQDPLSVQIVPAIEREYFVQREWILQRLRENRERYAEEPIFSADGIEGEAVGEEAEDEEEE